MSDIFSDGLSLPFPKLKMAEDFVTKLRGITYKIDIITLNEVLQTAGEEIPKDLKIKGLQYGYSRKDIKRLKPRKARKGFVVSFDAPSLMLRDKNGYWTTERELHGKE